MCLRVNSSKHTACFFLSERHQIAFLWGFLCLFNKIIFFLLNSTSFFLLNPLLPNSDMWVAFACSAYIVIVGDLMGEPSGCCMCGGVTKVRYNIPWLLSPTAQRSAGPQEEKMKKQTKRKARRNRLIAL